MQEERLKKLGAAARAPIIFMYEDGRDAVLSGSQETPVLLSRQLRQQFVRKASDQELPLLIRDEFELYYACIHAQEGFCMIGPMSVVPRSDAAVRAMFRKYGWQGDRRRTDDTPQLHVFTGGQILAVVCIAAELLTGIVYTEEEILSGNHLSLSVQDEAKEKAEYSLSEEEQDEYEETWRHSYRQEHDMLDAVREGRGEDAVSLSREMDQDSGRLSSKALGHWRNLAVIGITLSSRAAIDSGISPGEAYRISGFYISRCDSCSSAAEILSMRDAAIREFAGRVSEKKRQQNSSNYTELCKNYISRHYREKLYLEDAAGKIGISPYYLSRRFRKDTGTTFQEYLTRVRIDRASNMLKYSELTLAQIAEYVNFPSQSYFGRVFREHMHMTPRQYRDRYKAAEWESGKGPETAGEKSRRTDPSRQSRREKQAE